MLGGLHDGVSLPIGDPNFFNHDRIESGLGDAWKEQMDKVNKLSTVTRELASDYGYRLGEPERYELAPAQKTFLNRYSDDPVWHIVQHYTLTPEHDLKVDRLKKSLQRIVQKHPVLRHRFILINGTWEQEEMENVGIEILHEKLREPDSKTRRKGIKEIEKQLNEQLDVELGKLVACAFASLGEGRHHLILVIHHLVSDGVSCGQIFKELFKNYHALDEEKIEEDRRY